jgi:putative ABC transport system ATP-binding protein
VDTILNLSNVSKTYQSLGRSLTVLDNINFSVEGGSTLAIVGPSGSGKTTLLGLCAGLDRSTTGSIDLHYPSQLSGGEQQRVSLARAFSNKPGILFADEPTGSLDSETSEKVIELIFGLNKEAGTTLVLVTHDNDLASRTGRIIRIKGGRIVADERQE